VADHVAEPKGRPRLSRLRQQLAAERKRVQADLEGLEKAYYFRLPEAYKCPPDNAGPVFYFETQRDKLAQRLADAGVLNAQKLGGLGFKQIRESEFGSEREGQMAYVRHVFRRLGILRRLADAARVGQRSRIKRITDISHVRTSSDDVGPGVQKLTVEVDIVTDSQGLTKLLQDLLNTRKAGADSYVGLDRLTVKVSESGTFTVSLQLFGLFEVDPSEDNPGTSAPAGGSGGSGGEQFQFEGIDRF
jgi:hypothetical protein